MFVTGKGFDEDVTGSVFLEIKMARMFGHHKMAVANVGGRDRRCCVCWFFLFSLTS